ncbi:larval cuticle protein A3A-like [Diachasma alloeum]|uniref:larval cuticle protein A3A-like n=1 Tax=Diachasma alloeum TaxID=454923 RepID=UPI000738462D|nr:larval cuticle protein A3A-like [Diachasma alloeum]
MAYRELTICLSFLALTHAGYIGAPVAYQSPAKVIAPSAILTKALDADYDPHPQYSYSYDVQDSITGDFKSQHETRDGDVVQGSYSLLDSDGTRRTVDYTADAQNGFNAVVRKEPITEKLVTPVAGPIVQPAVAYGPPALAKYPVQLPAATYAPALPQISAAVHSNIAVSPALTYGPPATPIATHEAASYPAAALPARVYSAPVGYATPAVAKYSPHPYIAHVTYTTPLFSYSH